MFIYIYAIQKSKSFKLLIIENIPRISQIILITSIGNKQQSDTDNNKKDATDVPKKPDETGKNPKKTDSSKTDVKEQPKILNPIIKEKPKTPNTSQTGRTYNNLGIKQSVSEIKTKTRTREAKTRTIETKTISDIKSEIKKMKSESPAQYLSTINLLPVIMNAAQDNKDKESIIKAINQKRLAEEKKVNPDNVEIYDLNIIEKIQKFRQKIEESKPKKYNNKTDIATCIQNMNTENPEDYILAASIFLSCITNLEIKQEDIHQISLLDKKLIDTLIQSYSNNNQENKNIELNPLGLEDSNSSYETTDSVQPLVGTIFCKYFKPRCPFYSTIEQQITNELTIIYEELKKEIEQNIIGSIEQKKAAISRVLDELSSLSDKKHEISEKLDFNNPNSALLLLRLFHNITNK